MLNRILNLLIITKIIDFNMFNRSLLAFALLLAGTGSSIAQVQPTFLSNPTISPDAKTIVFSYEGDLWKVPTQGGPALRITAMDGNEISPRISPDGKWLAFSSNQNGNMDVYVMPLAGGEIRQITHHDGADDVASWSWDSKSIYFTSTRENRMSSYKVDAAGGTAQRIIPHFFNYIHNMVETPSGELLFTDSFESYSSANRKRYKGAFNPDIKGYNPKDNSFKDYTTYIGKDLWPTVDRKGNVFFASDEGNDEYNLYTFSGGKKTELTNFKESIRTPQVSANGEAIIFERGYQLYVYDVASKKTTQPNIIVSRNQVLGKSKEFDVRGAISNFDVSPDGKKLAFVSRGELFVSDVDGKFIRQMPSAGERIMEVSWLKDNRTLVYNQTVDGYLNWFSRSADGKGAAKQLTSDKRNNRDLNLNNERTKAVYLSGRDEVRILDLASLKSNTIVKDELWAFQNSSPSFSPDGQYVLFTAIRNFEQDIFVHHLADNKTMNLTNTGVSETSPVFSADGKYIYFSSNRTKPSYPMGMGTASIYRMALENFDEPYRVSKFDELFAEPKKEQKDTTTTKKPDDKNKPAKPTVAQAKPAPKKNLVTIDVNGLMDRIQQVSPFAGSQFSPKAFSRGDKQFLFFLSNHEGKLGMYRITYEPFTAPKTEKVADGSVDNLIEVEGRYYILANGNFQKYNIDFNRVEPVEISSKFNRDLDKEFKQMFFETWANVEENFYDSTFHGVDWEGMKKKYAAYLPGINNRNDLRILLNDMLGELNASHLGFSSMGTEERKNFNFVSNELGVTYDQKNPYKIASIVRNGPASRKGIDLQAGDELVAINGNPIDKNMDRDYYLTMPSLAPELQLSIKRNGKESTINIRPQSSAAFRESLYDEWIKGNRNKVDQLSGNRIAYSHMKNMSTSELNTFLLDMAEQENNKDGIILDLRYNTGGNVHDEVLRFLSQRPYLQWQYRGGKRAPQSNFAPASKPIVLLINEQSLSDAEMTAAGFKELKLGKIIGTETYRWIIFTSAKSLVDGSSYRLPGWGCYTLDGQDLELTGVAPDIAIKNTTADRIADKDPQLEKAVSEILKDLKK